MGPPRRAVSEFSRPMMTAPDLPLLESGRNRAYTFDTTMKNITFRLTTAVLLLPSWGWACLEEVLTPAEAAAKAQADAHVFSALCLFAAAWLVYRNRDSVGALLTRLRARRSELEAAVTGGAVTRLAVGVASVSLGLFLYGNLELSSLPSEGCGDIKLFKALF